MRLWGRDLIQGVRTLIRRDSRHLGLSLCVCLRRRTRQEGVRQQARKTSPESDHSIVWSRTSGLQNWENKCLFLKAPSLWYFVMAAQADKHSNAFNSHYSLLFENINYNAYFGSTTPMDADCLRIWPLVASPSRYHISNSSQKWSKVKMGKLPKACLWNLPEPLCHSQLQAEEPISSPKHMPPH